MSDKQKQRRDRIKARTLIKTFDDPCLSKVCEPVSRAQFRTPEIFGLMRYVCKNLGGVGLAAPQIGRLRRIILVHNKIYINPEIAACSKEMEIRVEGCLSYPGHFVAIKRHKQIEIRALNEEFTATRLTAEGLTARIFQHEIDHLDGICLVGDSYFKAKT